MMPRGPLTTLTKYERSCIARDRFWAHGPSGVAERLKLAAPMQSSPETGSYTTAMYWPRFETGATNLTQPEPSQVL